MPPAAKPLPNVPYGRLRIICGPFWIYRPDKTKYKACQCECQCGKVVMVTPSNLRKGNTQSCGCLQKARLSEAVTTHGESNSKLHWVWKAMKGRCFNEKDKSFKNYGARGITVCDEWRDDFAVFKAWADANGYREGLSIERENNDGDYTPGNCKWIPLGQQRRNNRNIRVIEAFGESKILADWAKDPRCIVAYSIVLHRLKVGWSPETAMTTPVGPRGRKRKEN